MSWLFYILAAMRCSACHLTSRASVPCETEIIRWCVWEVALGPKTVNYHYLLLERLATLLSSITHLKLFIMLKSNWNSTLLKHYLSHCCNMNTIRLKFHWQSSWLWTKNTYVVKASFCFALTVGIEVEHSDHKGHKHHDEYDHELEIFFYCSSKWYLQRSKVICW